MRFIVDVKRLVLLVSLVSTFPLFSVFINDFSTLNKTLVSAYHKPTTVEQVQTIVQQAQGKISIAGGQYSHGGQTIASNGTVIDMKALDKIVDFSLEDKTITVQSGALWADVQAFIDRYNLAIAVMQSYCDFTVGGSLAVNVHGRYLGYGPIIQTVKSIKIVVADGSLMIASRTENADLFFAAIGGYGAVGVIVEVTLQLTDNEKMERKVVQLSVTEYKDFFLQYIKSNPDALLHNADLYPHNYNKVSSITWYKTDKPLTVDDRLKPATKGYGKHTLNIMALKRIPGIKWLRSYFLDHFKLEEHPVVWRNYEAGYRVKELQYPTLFSHAFLQEYFVPIEQFDVFVNKMKAIFQKYQVNVLNVSIRHVAQNDESLLSWSSKESFAFVIYYDQWKSQKELEKSQIWTRELIQAVLSLEGSYYLPYRLEATQDQFEKAYPGSRKFFEIKNHYDPSNRFSNALLEKYF